jgi:hypothetical protein
MHQQRVVVVVDRRKIEDKRNTSGDRRGNAERGIRRGIDVELADKYAAGVNSTISLG